MLSEAADTTREKGKAAEAGNGCLYLGGVARQESILLVGRRLGEVGVKYQSLPKDAVESSGYWVRVAPESQRLLDDLQLLNLSKEFNELKHKIMPCEGVAPAE
ncbi:hypothetical protein J2X66_005170 [Pseudomonas sp. 3296]|nr:hypothetical protein [Pseudomonas sp. 3296]